MKKNRTTVSAAVSMACSIVAGQATAQEPMEEVIVYGIRGSLINAMDVKRDSSGVVDAISAEDIGKFPDSNIAESLQRVTGVSIDRVEGEGSNVTVRGFGGQFNLTTLNGRQMPAANVQNIGNDLFQARGNSRSFDFSVLASEGVTGLRVYKTGRASAPSGGIGAMIDVSTLRPLESGTRFAVGAKAVDDAGADGITPEFSGLASFSNDDQTIGVSLFASYQERDGSTRTGNQRFINWIYPYDPNDPAVVNAEVINEPATGSLAGYTTNVRVEYAETHRERSNAMLTLQFAPSDRLTITADALYTIHDLDHNSLQDQQFFARNFSYVEWDGSDIAATPITLVEPWTEVATFTEAGTDILHDNRWIRSRDEMTSVGLGFDYAHNDELSFNLDLATSSSESGGNWPGGWNVYRTAIAGAVSGWRAVDFSGEVPRTLVAITDGWGDQDGIYEIGDVGSQVFQRLYSDQRHDLDQVQLSGSWYNGGAISVDFGIGHVRSEMTQFFQNHVDSLGGWSIADTGDIERMAPGSITQICINCEFRDYNFDASHLASFAPDGASLMSLGDVSMWVNPQQLQYALDGYLNPRGQIYDAHNPTPRSAEDNIVGEDTTSVYIEASMEGQIGNKDMQVVAGLRWDSTDVRSAARQQVPLAVIWGSASGLNESFSSDLNLVDEKHTYSNLLPTLDFSVDLSDALKARASFSKTLARPQYSLMFLNNFIRGAPTPSYFGGIARAEKGSGKLDALESDNFDLSLEYYYSKSSYASVGYFQKTVSNFPGITQIDQPLFGLRDAASGLPGTRSGDAIAALDAGDWPVNPGSMFTMTAILNNPQDFPNGANHYDGTADQRLAISSLYEIIADNADPLIIFRTQQPVNDQTFKVNGLELAWQHFFGDTGFGFMANMTLVDGDIRFDNAAPPTADQFALEGLSDSANLILVWENEVFGARLAYNWRDKFLEKANVVNYIPLYFDEHGQLDVNLSWNVSDRFSLSLDGINLGEEGIIARGRTETMVLYAKEYDARWVLAARYNF